jgi:hypothetical protein
VGYVARSDRAGRHPGPAVSDEADLESLEGKVDETSKPERISDVDYG